MPSSSSSSSSKSFAEVSCHCTKTDSNLGCCNLLCVCVCVWIRFRSMDVQMVVLMHIALCHLLGWHCQLYPIYTAFLCLCLYLCLYSLWYAVDLWKWALTQCIEHFILRWTMEFSITDTIHMSHPHTQSHTHTQRHIAVCILNIGFTWFYLNASNEFSMSNANEIEIYCLRFESAFAMMRCIVLHTAIIHIYIHSYTFIYIYIYILNLNRITYKYSNPTCIRFVGNVIIILYIVRSYRHSIQKIHFA